MNEIIAKIYDKLPASAEQIRRDVFVREQGFVGEFDEIDERATHIVLFADGEPAATCRVYETNETFIVGRVATSVNRRGGGLGSRLLAEAEKAVRAAGGQTIELSAQRSARAFYEKNGYVAYGGVYYDEGVEHIAMKKELL